MKMKLALPLAVACAAAIAAPAFAEPNYHTIEMEIDVAKPAKDVWSKIGGYCDITEWLGAPCEITSGDGGIGSVRSLVNGAVIEVMVAQTALSYGYTQPVSEDRPYDLYHGFLEAVPVNSSSSKLKYTLMYDNSLLADDEARKKDAAGRRAMFEGALANMKKIAEGG